MKMYRKLVVTSNKGADVNGLKNATIYDCVAEENIFGFGNCIRYPDSPEEEEKLMRYHDEMDGVMIREEGTCPQLMKLESEWENYIIEGEYQTFGDDNQSGITMTSMLFCKHGGLIYPVRSGQDAYVEDIWTEVEKRLLNKFGDDIEYSNWSDEKKRCAEELWKRFYVEGGYDAYFVAGLIGNMYGEANVGMLQFTDWSQIISSRGEIICEGGKVITNIEQAEVACLVADDNFGIGMMQWSFGYRKKHLLENYKLFQSADGTLSVEQMINAECKTIKEELEGNLEDDIIYKKDVCDKYQEEMQKLDNAGETIALAAGIVFRNYERPQGWDKVVDEKSFQIVDWVWADAETKDSFNGVPSICKRVIAAKMAYEEFMGKNEE